MELELGKKYNVKVMKLLDFGIVVKLLDSQNNRTELIHVSQISDKFVKNIESFVSVGNEYEAEAVSGNGKGKDVQLSLKHLHIEPIRVSKPVEFVEKPKINKSKNFKKHEEFIKDKDEIDEKPVSHSRNHKPCRNKKQDIFDNKEFDSFNKEKSRRKERYVRKRNTKRRDDFDY